MAYYYVKSGGTATGDGGRYVSQKSGSWATAFTATSEYYGTLEAARSATTAPNGGDYVLVSDLHDATYTGSQIDFSSGSEAASLSLVSVDDANCDVYKPGAKEALTGTTASYYRFDYNVLVAGFDLETKQNILRANNNLRGLMVRDCTLRPDTTNDRAMYTTVGPAFITFINVDVIPNTGNANVIYNASNGGVFNWYGGTLGTNVNRVFENNATDGGTFNIKGVDLSVATNTLLHWNNPPYGRAVFNSCKLGVGITLHNTGGGIPISTAEFEMYNCDDATGGDYHRFHYETGAGVAKNNDATYVTATEPWNEGSVKSSIEVTTTSRCNHALPFSFELISQYVDLAQVGSDVLTIELVTDLTLTDTDIAAFLVYPDGTTPVNAHWITSSGSTVAGSYAVDPLAAGTTLTTGALGAGDWTGEPVSPNFYKMVLDTSGDAGQAAAVSIRIEVYKPSITAGKLFIHPLLTLS